MKSTPIGLNNFSLLAQIYVTIFVSSDKGYLKVTLKCFSFTELTFQLEA